MKEQLLYIRRLTVSKIINLLKLYVSFWYSKWRGKPYVWGKPATLTIEPTTACNLGCPECPSGLRSFTRPTGNIKEKTVDLVLDQLAPHLAYLNYYFQGEPFIHKDFFRLIEKAHHKGVYTCTSTNAHFINDKTAEATIKSGLDKLIISLDGITQEVYESYRINGELNKVLDGAKKMMEWKQRLNSSTPLVVFQFLVVRPNEHQIEDAKNLAIKIGVDKINFKTAQIYDFENGNPLIPSIDRYSRYKKSPNGTYTIKNNLENQCWRMWRGSVLTWDGKVIPCCFDKDAKHEMGNINLASFENIWKSRSYMNFRNSILKSRSSIEICKNCSEGTRVW